MFRSVADIHRSTETTLTPKCRARKIEESPLPLFFFLAVLTYWPALSLTLPNWVFGR